MSDMWEKASLGHDRTWARASAKLLRDAPPGSTVEMGEDGKPVLRTPRKTIAQLRNALDRAQHVCGVRPHVGQALPGRGDEPAGRGRGAPHVLTFPKAQWKTLLTTNVIERLHREVR